LKVTDTIESIRENVQLGFGRRSEQKILEIFNRYATFYSSNIFGRSQVVRPWTVLLIHKEQFKSALGDLNIFMREEDISKIFNMMDMDDNKGLDLMEFKKTIQVRISEIIYLNRPSNRN
jgi:hypothetical protein